MPAEVLTWGGLKVCFAASAMTSQEWGNENPNINGGSVLESHVITQADSGVLMLLFKWLPCTSGRLC